MEQQERERAAQQQASPREGTPVGALGVVPPPTAMGMLNQAMPPMSGNPQYPQRQRQRLGTLQQPPPTPPQPSFLLPELFVCLFVLGNES